MGLVTLVPYVAGQILTAAQLNNNFNAIANQVNGSLDSINLANLSVTSSKLASSSVTSSKLSAGLLSGLTTVVAVPGDYSLISDTSDGGNIKKSLISDFFTPTSSNALSGSVVQVVNYQTGAQSTGSVAIPLDGTIPQNTEGVQYMSLSITPTSATNKLKIDVVFCHLQHSTSLGTNGIALFQDSTANALAAVFDFASDNVMTVTNFSHYMIAGTTSTTTFKVRAGRDTATTLYFNYAIFTGGNLGGVIPSSITITEIKA